MLVDENEIAVIHAAHKADEDKACEICLEEWPCEIVRLATTVDFYQGLLDKAMNAMLSGSKEREGR